MSEDNPVLTAYWVEYNGDKKPGVVNAVNPDAAICMENLKGNSVKTVCTLRPNPYKQKRIWPDGMCDHITRCHLCTRFRFKGL